MPTPPATPVFELRTYTAQPGRLDDLMARFRNHTLKLFAKHGMQNIGYWLPLDAADGAGDKLIYLLRHRSREAAEASWTAFRADPEWQAVVKASEATGKLVLKIEKTYLAAADYSPMS